MIKIAKLLFLFLIVIWFSISFFRTIYNFSKILTEELRWINLSDDQKRVKIFGDYHQLFKLIENKTNLYSKILFVTTDGQAYYPGRYYLYPRKVFWTHSLKSKDISILKNNYNYLFLFTPKNYATNSNRLVFDHSPVATYSALKNLNLSGVLYSLYD